jgi:hypothetical protein
MFKRHVFFLYVGCRKFPTNQLVRNLRYPNKVMPELREITQHPPEGKDPKRLIRAFTAASQPSSLNIENKTTFYSHYKKKILHNSFPSFFFSISLKYIYFFTFTLCPVCFGVK